MSKKKRFDYCLGNPPYMGESQENNRKPPVYNIFMNAAYNVADVVELITPARFLFDAGQTPKDWNHKMLNDEHFKVLMYESDGTKIFPNVDLKGGVCIHYHDTNKDFGAIEIFSPYEEIRSILPKVKDSKGFIELGSIVTSRGFYRFTEKFFGDFPSAPDKMGKGTGNMIATNALEVLPEVFSDKPSKKDSLKIIGRLKNSRVSKYIDKDYVIDNPFIHKYNVSLPKVNGTGKLGEIFSNPFVTNKNEITTDSFISMGFFDTKSEATCLLKYIETKFARTMLSIRKVTPDNSKDTWKYVPLQDFTPSSDIDWSKSIHEIDEQLYKKYDLDQHEIDFIETNVKEMN